MAHSDADLAKVKAMEVACTFSPVDFDDYVREGGPVEHGELCKGFQYSGSYCGRNIEKIYQKAAPSGRLSLRGAVDALLGAPQVKHVLIISGFFVLHERGGKAPNGSAGSCETDGPLGALAILRALAARGVRASLFCDEHNGPVLQKAYDSMMAHFASFDSDMHASLLKFSSCLPAIGDSCAGADASIMAERRKALGGGTCTALQDRWALLAHRLGQALDTEVDALVALERLGAPYRNIRGVDIGAETEPIDFLFPFLDWEGPGDEEMRRRVRSYAEEQKYTPQMRESLCRVAKVSPTAVTLGIGDGGNEVGMGAVVAIPGVPQLSPGDEFAALSANGCYRTCDHLLLGTVSNWAGSAFEAAASVLYPLPAKKDYMVNLNGGRLRPGDLEELLLRDIMASPTFAVDGKYNDRLQSVDGMSFDPYHRDFHIYLWELVSQTQESRKSRRLE